MCSLLSVFAAQHTSLPLHTPPSARDAIPRLRSVACALRFRRRRCLHRCRRASRSATGYALESAAEHGCLPTIVGLGWDAEGCDPNSERGGSWHACVRGAARRSPRSSHGGPKPQRYMVSWHGTAWFGTISYIRDMRQVSVHVVYDIYHTLSRQQACVCIIVSVPVVAREHPSSARAQRRERSIGV